MGLDRRGFIQFLVGGAVGSLFTPIPWKLTDDISIWTQNWPWVPRIPRGENGYIPTTSKLCPSACGMRVRTVKGLPVRTLGDPKNPLSGGKISSLAAAEVQLLYSPARVKRPLKKGLDGTFVSISWDEALELLRKKLGSIKGLKNQLAFISGDQNGTINEVLSGFTKQCGSDRFFLMPSEAQAGTRAWNIAMGGKGQLGFDTANSDLVLAIGADILESWGPAVLQRRAFSASHPHGEKAKAEYIYAGPVKNNTGTVSQWLPLKPGTEGYLAMGLCNLLIEGGAVVSETAVSQTVSTPEGSLTETVEATDSTAVAGGSTMTGVKDFAGFKKLAKQYTPEKVQALTGVSPEALTALAKKLKAASKPVVIVGSPIGQGESTATIIAGIALNLLLGGLNKPGGMQAIPDIPKVIKAAMDRTAVLSRDPVSYLANIAGGTDKAPAILFVYEANPAYGLPQPKEMTAALKKIPIKVSFSQFLDETAMLCDLVLPSPMGLERFDDVINPYGIGFGLYSPVFPVVKPLVDARPTGDVILALAKALNMDLGYGSFKDVLSARTEQLGASFDDLLGKYIQSNTQIPSSGLSLKPALLAASLPLKDKAEALSLAPMFKLNYGTGNVATPYFNLKTIPDTQLKGSYSFVQMNKATAAKLGVSEGQKVAISSKSASFVVMVNLFEGVMNDVVAAPLGLGHTAFDEFTKDKGSNISALMTLMKEPETGLPVWTDTKVEIKKI